jgi:hypothetical protein
MEKVVQIKQQDIDAISDKDLENEVCLSEKEYLFIDGPLIVRENTRIRIPQGTNLKIKDE